MGLPVLAMFVLWLAYGVWQWKRSSSWLLRMQAISRNRKPFLAMAYLFGGASILLASLYGVYAMGGFPKQGIAGWAWPICAAAGLVFVHAQVTAGAMLVSMAVTPQGVQPSEQEKERS